jgi:hypothetical protein
MNSIKVINIFDSLIHWFDTNHELGQWMTLKKFVPGSMSWILRWVLILGSRGRLRILLSQHICLFSRARVLTERTVFAFCAARAYTGIYWFSNWEFWHSFRCTRRTMRSRSPLRAGTCLVTVPWLAGNAFSEPLGGWECLFKVPFCTTEKKKKR